MGWREAGQPLFIWPGPSSPSSQRPTPSFPCTPKSAAACPCPDYLWAFCVLGPLPGQPSEGEGTPHQGPCPPAARIKGHTPKSI